MRSVNIPIGFLALSLVTFASLASVPVARAQIFVTNSGNNTVSRISSDGKTITTLVLASAGLNKPFGIAFGAGGDLFVSNYGGTTVSRISPLTGQIISTITGIPAPFYSTYRESTGDLFVGSHVGRGTIDRIDSSGQVSTFATGPNYYPRGLAFTPNGSLFVGDDGGEIRRIDASTGTSSPVINIGGFNQSIYGLVSDTTGNLYAVDGNSTAISRITTGATPTVTRFASGFNLPEGLTFLPNGNLLVTDAGGIKQVTPDGVVSVFASGGGLNRPSGIAVAGSAATVPESGSLALASVALIALVGIVRRKNCVARSA